MRRLWRLATRSWFASPGRTIASVVSLMLGVGTVVTITSIYETARATIEHEVLQRWLGSAHLSIHPIGAHWGSIPNADELVEKLQRIPNVTHVTKRMRRRMRLILSDQVQPARGDASHVDATGIDIESEKFFRTWVDLSGRMFLAGERGVAMVERQLARMGGAAVGDTVTLTGLRGGRRLRLKVVGVFDGQRIGDFQSPYIFLPLADLQSLTGVGGDASVVDVMLRDSSTESLTIARAAVEDVLAQQGLSFRCSVSSSETRQLLLDEADRLAKFSLMLVSGISLLTSFFIIVTTMSMSLFERRAAFGTMRCIGMTRSQLALLVMMELIPIGVVGTICGVLSGAGLVELIEYLASLEVNISLQLSTWGILLASAGGIITTLITAVLLIVMVVRVTPLEAVRVHARPARISILYLCGAAGLALILTHEWMINGPDPVWWLNRAFAGFGTAALYFGYVLMTPALVVVLGPPMARIISPILGLPSRLVSDQFRRAPWRCAGTCWTLLVGLSLMVYIALAADTMMSLYDFSGRLPDTFLWARKFVPSSTLASIRKMPGVADITQLADVDCKIINADKKRGSVSDAFLGALLGKLTRPVFVAGDVQRITEMVKVTFDEGSRDEAIAKIKRGGYVLIPAQTAKNKGLHLGDRVRIGINDREAEFEIAGVVQSPILDLTVTAFQAHNYLQFAAAAVVFGSHEDLRDKFGLDVFTMVMADLDLGDVPPPPEFQRDKLSQLQGPCEASGLFFEWSQGIPSEAETRAATEGELRAWLANDCQGKLPRPAAVAIARMRRAMNRILGHWQKESPEERWSNFREQLVLLRMADAIGVDNPIMGSIRRMKEINGAVLRRAGAALTWLPSIILVVAAIGIGNLMMVGVQVRARQLAMLRALGALKSQITRLILAESIALALVGSVSGIGLGIHQTMSDNRVVGALTGIQPAVTIPWMTLAGAAMFTVLVCLAAGWMPARAAGRSNVIEALHAV